MQKSYCYTPGVSVGVGVSVRVGVRVHMQNVRANVKVLKFHSFCIFSCILSLLIILIKPLTSKAYDRRASGDCGTSGSDCSRILTGYSLCYIQLNILCGQRDKNAYVLIGLLYVVGFVLHIPHLPTNLHFSCKRDDHNLFTYEGLWSFVLSTILLTACDVVVYFYIGVLAIKVRLSYHSIGKNDYKNFSLATLKTFLLSIITVAMLGPFEIRAAINLWNFDDYRFYDSRTAAILAVFHQIVSPILILISYKECRYHLAAFCLCCCKGKKETIERDYKQYYATFAITPAGNEVCSIR